MPDWSLVPCELVVEGTRICARSARDDAHGRRSCSQLEEKEKRHRGARSGARVRSRHPQLLGSCDVVYLRVHSPVVWLLLYRHRNVLLLETCYFTKNRN